ncbi:hypothetical protein ACVSQ4_27390 [Klebsiella pneumoniae]
MPLAPHIDPAAFAALPLWSKVVISVLHVAWAATMLAAAYFLYRRGSR